MLSHIFINYRLSTLRKTTVLFVHQYGTDTPLGSYTTWVQREKQRFAKRAQNTLTSHLLMPQGVLEIKSNPVRKGE